MPATVTDSTKPNPLSPATSSGESPLAAHNSSTDRLAPVTTAAAAALGAPAAAVSSLFASPLCVLASTCGGTGGGVTAGSGSRGSAVPLARLVVAGDAGGPGGRLPSVVVASARRSVAV